jgi:hypothetical protein
MDLLSLPTIPLAQPEPPRELRPARGRIHPRRRGDESLLGVNVNESIRVVAPSGQTLLRIGWASGGPMIELGENDVALRISGKLAIDAEEIDLSARGGPVRVTAASDDVVIRGEKIRLN